MIKREAYMGRIRPFIDKDLVKVFTGIRRSGKSTLLKLVQQELIAGGVLGNQIQNKKAEKRCRWRALYFHPLLASPDGVGAACR